MSAADDRFARNVVLSVCDLKQQGSEGPSSIAAAQMVIQGTKAYLFGGCDERQSYADLYCLDIIGASWKRIDVAGLYRPLARYGHAMVAIGDELVVLGGLIPTRDEMESELDEPVLPPPPFCPSSEAHDVKPRLWFHRGSPCDEILTFNLSDSKWTHVETRDNAPAGCRMPCLAFHSAAVISWKHGGRNLILIWGGAQDETLTKGSGGIFVLDWESKSWIHPIKQVGAVPSARLGHRVTFIPSTAAVYLFGGSTTDETLYSLDVSNLISRSASSSPATEQCSEDLKPLTTEIEVAWSSVECSGTPPLPRQFHSFDLVGEDRLFLFAGTTLVVTSSDFYVYNLKRCKWTRPVFDGEINLSAHSTCVLHDKVLVFGGVRQVKSTAWALPPPKKKESRQEDLDVSNETIVARTMRKLFFLATLEIKPNMAASDRFKLVAVGDSAVGKSCLLERFVQDVYDRAHPATVGCDFHSIVAIVKGKLITLHLWDTAGQERYSAVTGNYFRNADGFILVYDVTRRATFDHIVSWIDRIRETHEFGQNTVKLLVGNKGDLVDEIRVSTTEAKTLADSLGAIYLGTSAKTGAGVDAAFLLAARQLVEIRSRTANQVKGFSPPSHGVPLGNISDEDGIFSACTC